LFAVQDSIGCLTSALLPFYSPFDVSGGGDDNCNRRDDRATTVESDDHASTQCTDGEATTIATAAVAARVGAMDVSRSEAQRAETNVIARSGDRATTMGIQRSRNFIHKKADKKDKEDIKAR
jgi:hypothetical protein